jgi:tetratricopeptide (TPR) repeat protein
MIKTIELKYEPYIGDNSPSYLLNFVVNIINDLFPEISIVIPKSINWQTEEVPHEYSRKIARIGDENCGLDIMYYENYEPKYGSLQTYSITIATYDLPDNTYLELVCNQTGHSPQYISIKTTGPDDIISEIASAFEFEFGRIKPTDEDIDIMVSSIYCTLNAREWDSAEKKAEFILRYRPKNIDALFALGVAKGAKGDPDNAEKFLNSVLEQSPNHYDALYNLGIIYIEKENYEKAIECFKRSLIIMPDNHAVLYQFGRALEANDQLEEAYDSYLAAVRTSPNPYGAWHYSGADFTKEANTAVKRLEKYIKR